MENQLVLRNPFWVSLLILYSMSLGSISAQESTAIADLEGLVLQGDRYASQLKSVKAEGAYDEAWSIAKATLPADDIRLLRLEMRRFIYPLEYESVEFEDYLTDLDRRFRLHPNTEAVDYAMLHFQYGLMHGFRNNSHESLAHYETAENYWNEQSGPVALHYQDWKLGTLYSNLGKANKDLGRFDLARQYYQWAYDLLKKNDCPQLQAVVLGNQALEDEREYAYQRAVDRNEEALRILADAVPADNYFLNNIRNNLGVVYFKINEMDKAREAHRNVLSTYEKNSPVPVGVVTDAHLQLGNVERLLKHYDRALNHLNDAYAQEQLRDQPNLYRIEQQLAAVHTSLGDSENARLFNDRALDHVIAYYGSLHHSEVASQYLMMAESGLKLEDLDRTEIALKETKSILDFTNQQEAFSTIPNWEILLDYYLLRTQFEIARYRETGQKTYLEQGATTCREATNTIERLRANMMNRSSRVALQRNFYEINRHGLTIHLLLDADQPNQGHREQSFAYAERQHHNLLYEDGQRAATASEQARELMQRINHYEDQLYDELSYGTDAYPDVVADMKHRLYLAKEELRIKQQGESLTFDAIDFNATYQWLSERNDEYTIVEYAEGVDSTYAFVFGGGEVSVHSLGAKEEIARRAEELTKRLRDYPTPKESEKDRHQKWQRFLSSAHGLYERVMQPLADKLTEQIVVIPTPPLANIPFDVLVKKPASGEKGTPDYLILDHVFSVAYSGRLLKQHQVEEPSTESEGGILGFAPSYELDAVAMKRFAETKDGHDLPPNMELFSLKHNQKEVKKLVKSYGGEALTGRSATEQQFRERLSDYSIVHVAAHAFANERNGDRSRLAFAHDPDAPKGQQANLYASEVMTLDCSNNALITLSACETNAGEYKLGEGVIGMAHGFVQAGAQSVIATQWVVDDRATEQLMLAFYQKLSEGFPKDKAMSFVKRAFLRSHSVEEMRHPYFWAAPVVIGDVRPVDHYLSGSTPLPYRRILIFGLIGLAITGILVIGFRYF